MANAENRPFSGTWTYNNKKSRRHVPDCIVTFNGETAMPSCTGCTGQIDLQDLITSVSVTNSTDTSPASVSLGMEIPTNRRSCFFRDNKFILHPGIEIHVYMRGYFSHTELGGAKGIDEKDAQEYNLNKATMKPYYQVFNGVITEVSHGYSGGFYSMSLSASDFLHFWQYQSIATNPSYLGSAVDGNKTSINFTGHKYTRKNPFSVVHELYSSGHGDAGGHEWVLSDFQNVGIKSDLYQASFWEITGYYWQKRFQQPMGKLKMYGTDGRLFNSFEQFLLSSDLISKGDAAKSSDKWSALGNPNTEVETLGSVNTYMDSLLTVLRHSSSKDGEVDKQAYAFPSSSLFFVDNTSWVADTAKGKGARGFNVAGVTAFALDINSLGQVNLFETQMQTKMDIASQVSTEIGYEFFIDFNGDYVFKPPLFNLDTSDSRVYTVKDIDLISFNTSEKEPECTVMKGTGGYFNNMTSLFGKEFENRGMFVDWRAVAKYGWRESSFETTFLNDPRSIYYAAMNRMALANKDIQSGDCTIPLRPEMKLGFPVYIEPFDVFYYVTGISHTFGYGSDCTTSLTLTAKRAKFFPPMNKQSRFPTTEDIDFTNIYRPNHALFTKNGQGQPKYMGFPCVVMGLDMTEINPLWFAYGEITNFLINKAGNSKGRSVGSNNYEGLLTLIRSMSEVERGLRWKMIRKSGKNSKGEAVSWDQPHAVVTLEDGEVDVDFEYIIDAAVLVRSSIEERIDSKDWNQFERNGAFLTEGLINDIRNSSEKYGEALVVFFKILDRVREKQSKGVQDGTNMEHYLASLKYMKSSFRPDDQQPGMYRYYSSAFPNDHPLSPTFQGMSDRTDANIDSFERESMSGLSINVVHEVENPEKRTKVIPNGDGTYRIVNPNKESSQQEVRDAGGEEVFLARYGIPVRHFLYRDETKGSTTYGDKVNRRNSRTYKVMPTEDIKTLVFSMQFLGRKRPQTLELKAMVAVDGRKRNYSLALPTHKTDNFPTGVTCLDVYKPFIDSHINAFHSVGAEVYASLRNSNQEERAKRWREHYDGMSAKYQKIIDKNPRTFAKTFSRRTKGHFQRIFKTLCSMMTKDLKTLVQYLTIIETLNRNDELSIYFNSSTAVLNATAQLSSTTSSTQENTEDLLKSDQAILKSIANTVKAKISVAVESDIALTERYEVLLLNGWSNHPCFATAPATRKDELRSIFKAEFSYFLECLVEREQQIKYRFRAAGEEPYYSPVFPVSDERGFEVFGQYAYGRGMTLKNLAEILDTPPDLWGELSPAELNRLYGSIGGRVYHPKRDKTSIRAKTSSEASTGEVLTDNYKSYDKNYRTTLNESIAQYITTRGATSVINQDLIDVVSSNGVDLNSSDEVFEFLQTWSEGLDGEKEVAAKIFEQAFVGNIITTNQQYGKKIASSNVPIELARLDQFYSPTSCSGGAANALSTSDAFMLESDQYSFAYNSNTGEFNETAWQQMLAENRVVDWFTHQEALRGTITDDRVTLESLTEDINAIGDAFTELGEALGATPNAFNQILIVDNDESTQTSSLPPPTTNEDE